MQKESVSKSLADPQKIQVLGLIRRYMERYVHPYACLLVYGTLVSVFLHA